MKVPAARYLVAGLAIGAVVVALVAGLVLLGSPAEERARRLDERRVDDLRRISHATDLYWTRHGRLPSSLDELSREPGVTVTRDANTAAPYEYRVAGANTYELCARFQRDSVERPQGAGGEFWSHGADRQCFQREAREIR